MPGYSKNEVILIRYPFTNLPESKVRPAIVVSAPHSSKDVFVVPVTSKITGLLSGEFVLADWATSGLNVVTAVKRGIYTINEHFIITSVGKLSNADASKLEISLRMWLGF